MSRRPLLSLPSVNDETDDADELEASTGAEPAAAQTAGVVATLTGADVSTPLTVEHVPAPYAPSDAAELSDQERADLATCERAVSGLQTSFALAGKALATINQARLYREEHSTFVDYVEARWQMSESQAYRLMDGWQVAALLAAHGLTVLNERQGRELNAVFKQHGGPAVVAVAKAVTEQVKKPTAAVVGTVRKALPRSLPADPEQRDRVIGEAVKGAVPRPASPNGGETAAAGPAAEGDVTPEQVETGAEAMARLEAAVAQQRQVYEEIPPDVLAAAMLYDLGRAERLRHEGAQYATRAGYRFRGNADES